ncbi:hypothetical protein BDW75DRAFT_225653 [Aspergillus navahoensis]
MPALPEYTLKHETLIPPSLPAFSDSSCPARPKPYLHPVRAFQNVSPLDVLGCAQTCIPSPSPTPSLVFVPALNPPLSSSWVWIAVGFAGLDRLLYG